MPNKVKILASSVRSLAPFYYFYNKSKITDKYLGKLEYILVCVGGVLMLAIALLGFSDVVGRYLFNSPILGAQEVSGLMMVLIICISWAYVQKQGSHIKMDFIVMKYGPRARAIVSLFALGITLVCFSLIAWQSTQIAISHWQENRLIATILIPQAPFELIVPFGSLLFCVEIIIQMLRIVAQMKVK